MLVVSDLYAGYGRIPILAGINLSVTKGRFTGVLGHNGMGKTTLLKAVMGYLPATAGHVLLNGIDITTARPDQRARLGIGYVPQGRHIFANLTVEENLRMGCLLAKSEEPAIIKQILVEFPRLARLLDRPGGALSGGEQQLLALARCMCGKPKLMLLDEPTEGIQPSITDEIVETLYRLRCRREITVLLVEQDLHFISALAENVMIIQKGVITRSVSPEQLTDPSVIAEFVGMDG